MSADQPTPPPCQACGQAQVPFSSDPEDDGFWVCPACMRSAIEDVLAKPPPTKSDWRKLFEEDGPVSEPTPPKVTDSIPPNRAWPEALDSLVGDPFSLCRCGHERQQHAPQGLSCHPGDGPCVHLGCECSGFTVQPTPTPPRPAVQEIQRWQYYRDRSPDGTFHGVRPHPDGQFVTYDDHAAALAASREENAELRKLLEARKGEYE